MSTTSEDAGSTVSSQPKSKRELAADAYVRPQLSRARLNFMLTLFCLGEFMDAFIASCLFPAINALQDHLHLKPTEVTWAFGAYTATFAAFLLISGRVSDVYSPRFCFNGGAFLIGAFSLGSGFAQGKVSFFILRAFAGIGAAANVPAALRLIVEWFPDPEEQNRAIALFGGGGGIGNILGVVIGGIFVQVTTWRWIMWLMGIAGIVVSILATIVVPPSAPRRDKPSWKRLDLGGVSLITAAIILFVYALTTGPITGWGSANCVAPLVISVVLGVVFFIFEANIPPEIAALPPRIWKYSNVPVLFALGFIPFCWWGTLFFQLQPLMMSKYGWSAIMSSVRFLPVGFSGTVVAITAPMLLKYWTPKLAISVGLTLQFIGTMLLPFADSKDKFWSHCLPAFIIGSSGTMLTYTNSNIAIFLNTPPEMAGVTGAVFNSALQLGITLGIAIAASITQSIDQNRINNGQDPGYQGIADAFWFMVAFIVALFIAVQVFYKPEPKTPVADAEDGAAGSVGDGIVEVSRAPFVEDVEDVQEKGEKHEAR